jgi:hypothetical protein
MADWQAEAEPEKREAFGVHCFVEGCKKVWFLVVVEYFCLNPSLILPFAKGEDYNGGV